MQQPLPLTPDAPPTGDKSRPRPLLQWLIPGLIVAAVGAAIAAITHVAWWFEFGTLEGLCSGDDVVYLSAARHPYYSGWSIHDPFAADWQLRPTLFSWLVFVPGARLGSSLGLPLLLLTLLWRLIGGALLGVALLSLYRALFGGGTRATLFALIATLVTLGDAGFVSGRPLLQNVLVLREWWDHSALPAFPDTFGVYRVVNPALNFPFLLLLAAWFVRPSRSIGAAAVAGIWLTLCVYGYFYFWTAALAGIGLFAMVRLVAAVFRWSRTAWADIRFAAIVAAVGLTLGAPQLISNLRTRADPLRQESLQRMARGAKVPEDSPVRFRYLADRPVLAMAALGLIVAAVAPSLRQLLFPAILVVAGYLLENAALWARLEFENFHWRYVGTGFGAVIVVSIAVKWLADRADRWPAVLPGLAVVAAALLVHAGAFRWLEATRCAEPLAYARLLGELRPLAATLAALPPSAVLAGPRQAAVALLFMRGGLLFQDPHSSHSSLAGNEEVFERMVLNSWMQGRAPSAESVWVFDAFAIDHLSGKEWAPAELRVRSDRLFATLQGDPAARAALLDRYRPTHLLLPKGQPANALLGACRLLLSTERWELWQIGD